MDDRIAKELRAAIDQHADSPELRELWLRVLGLQLLADDLSHAAQPRQQNANESIDPSLAANSKALPQSCADEG